MKGVSPVVATVLLIAIAVIAAIGVWYWVGAYTGKPAVGVEQKAMSITTCNTTHALVRNTGALAITQDADIYNSAGTKVGLLNITSITGGMDAGDVQFVPIYNTTGSATAVAAGIYNVIDSDYPEYTFSCA